MKTVPGELKVEKKSDTEFVMTRYFAAPRELVFDCFTKPELMRRWLKGPEGWTLDSCQVDLKVGGKYLFVYVDAKGARFGVYGKFLQVTVPEVVANDENYADMSAFDPNAPHDPNATVESRTFTSEGAGTRMVHVYKCASADAAKAALEGAVEGMADFYNGLDKLLSEIA